MRMQDGPLDPSLNKQYPRLISQQPIEINIEMKVKKEKAGRVG